MTETPAQPTATTTVPETAVEPAVTAPVVVERDKPNRLYQVAAWVAIVAGVVFIVGAVFFTGFFLGRQSGGGMHGGHFGPPGVMIERGGPMGPWGPMMRPGGPGGPGESGMPMGPMMRPGGPGEPTGPLPGPAGPGQSSPAGTPPR
ncbi:MAG: hypothetical protein HYZ38_02425 [Mycobacterium sp.]|nr:hypothetical protein [Mycobacterium sp.]